jgi:hypothetical protein
MWPQAGGEGPNEEKCSSPMWMHKAMRQMPEESGRAGVVRGESVHDPASDEAGGPRHERADTGLGLLGAALTRENLQRAFKRVRANNGAAGVDGLDIDQTTLHLKTHWPVIREQLLSVNHDILIDRLQRRIGDPGVIRLIRAYLNSGIMTDGVVVQRYQGTPQGGPLSPLLANVLLDEVDQELERRGHCFARYADDCNVYVGSRRAVQRVMAVLRRLYGKLHLVVNEAKSAVASVFGRKFLGYSLWVAKGGVVKCRVADKPMATFKQRVRQLTRRSGGRSMPEVAQRLRQSVRSWMLMVKVQLGSSHARHPAAGADRIRGLP